MVTLTSKFKTATSTLAIIVTKIVSAITITKSNIDNFNGSL